MWPNSSVYCWSAWCYQHISITEGQSALFKEWQWPMACHLAKLVSNWKSHNTTRTLTLPAQSQDMNTIENFWGKITFEIVKGHPTIKRKLIESLTAAWTGESHTWHDHLVKLSTQFRHYMLKSKLWAKVGPKYNRPNPSSKRKSGLLKTTIWY